MSKSPVALAIPFASGPRSAVWELTLRCNLRCRHCGSSAGASRGDEFTTEECLGIADQLAQMGCELVTLSGGEPTMHPGWEAIAERLIQQGVTTNMVTNGITRDQAHAREMAQRILKVGMPNVGVSVDGLEDIHDEIRGKGTFARTMRTIRTYIDAGLPVAMMTTVSQRNLKQLDALRRLALEVGCDQWRVQLAKPMGNMEIDRDFVLSKKQFLDMVPQLAAMKRKDSRIAVRVGDSIGYYDRHSRYLRNRNARKQRTQWQGCQAGLRVIGIEANGNVKGCLSMQAYQHEAHDRFVEGNLREHTLEEIWNRPGAFAYNRRFVPSELTGHCADCRHAQLCRGGARCVSSSFLRNTTEDPYCVWGLRQEAKANSSLPKAAALAAALLLGVSVNACSPKAETKTQDPCAQISCDELQEGDENFDECCEPSIGEEYAAPEPIDEPEYGIIEPVPEPFPEPPALEYGIRVNDPVPEPSSVEEYGLEIPAQDPTQDLPYGGVTGDSDEPVEPDYADEYGIKEPIPEPPALEYGIREPEALPADTAEYAVEEPLEPDAVKEYGIELPIEPAAAEEYGVEVPAEAEGSGEFGIGVEPEYPGVVAEYAVEEPIEPALISEYAVEEPVYLIPGPDGPDVVAEYAVEEPYEPDLVSEYAAEEPFIDCATVNCDAPQYADPNNVDGVFLQCCTSAELAPLDCATVNCDAPQYADPNNVDEAFLQCCTSAELAPLDCATVNCDASKYADPANFDEAYYQCCNRPEVKPVYGITREDD